LSLLRVKLRRLAFEFIERSDHLEAKVSLTSQIAMHCNITAATAAAAAMLINFKLDDRLLKERKRRSSTCPRYATRFIASCDEEGMELKRNTNLAFVDREMRVLLLPEGTSRD